MSGRPEDHTGLAAVALGMATHIAQAEPKPPATEAYREYFFALFSECLDVARGRDRPSR